MQQIKEWNLPVDFQGVDIRILELEHIQALKEVKHHKQIKIAWDDPKWPIQPSLEFLLQFMPACKFMCYVLIGYWSTPEQDLYRVETLREFGIDPFVMPYARTDSYQRRFARWVNHKAIFKSVKWEDYK